jgi:hypothetical protein
MSAWTRCALVEQRVGLPKLALANAQPGIANNTDMMRVGFFMLGSDACSTESVPSLAMT